MAKACRRSCPERSRAIWDSIRATTISAGTITTPPPMPNSPKNTSAMRPMRRDLAASIFRLGTAWPAPPCCPPARREAPASGAGSPWHHCAVPRPWPSAGSLRSQIINGEANVVEPDTGEVADGRIGHGERGLVRQQLHLQPRRYTWLSEGDVFGSRLPPLGKPGGACHPAVAPALGCQHFIVNAHGSPSRW